MKRLHCEVCEAPIPAGKRRGKPQRFCSEACRKVAQRRRAKDGDLKRCEYCGEPMKGDGRFCSDRCSYYGREGRVPFEELDLAAYDEGLFPTVPEGQIESFNAHQAREKPWRARVYGGKRSKGGGDDGGAD